MDDLLKQEIIKRIRRYEAPKRKAVTSVFPFLKNPVIYFRCLLKSFQNILNPKIKNKKRNDYFENVIAEYKVNLRKELTDGEAIRLQENKITNMKIAAGKLDEIIIEPKKIFSFWNVIGNPSYKNGYVDGRVYSKASVVKGVGGGLCQLSTFLYWLFLHTPVKIIERHPHTIDVNPSAKENVSSRSGATVLYNFIDLKIKNDCDYPIQLKLWFTENNLEGQILSTEKIQKNYRVIEKNHCFIKKDEKVYQYNEIYKETTEDGKLIKTEKVITNFYQILYDVSDEYVKENDYKVFDYNDLIGVKNEKQT